MESHSTLFCFDPVHFTGGVNDICIVTCHLLLWLVDVVLPIHLNSKIFVLVLTRFIIWRSMFVLIISYFLQTMETRLDCNITPASDEERNDFPPLIALLFVFILNNNVSKRLYRY